MTTVDTVAFLKNGVLGGQSVRLKAGNGDDLLLGRPLRWQLDVHVEILNKKGRSSSMSVQVSVSINPAVIKIMFIPEALAPQDGQKF